MYEQQKQEVIKAAILMDRYDLIALQAETSAFAWKTTIFW
jgi:hypothetical protein